MLNQSGLRDVISLGFCLVSGFEVQIVKYLGCIVLGHIGVTVLIQGR